MKLFKYLSVYEVCNYTVFNFFMLTDEGRTVFCFCSDINLDSLYCTVLYNTGLYITSILTVILTAFSPIIS